jgi:hypothetical protein
MAAFKGNENFHFSYHVDGMLLSDLEVNFDTAPEVMVQDYLPSYPNLVWYWDKNYTVPCIIGEPLGAYFNYYNSDNTSRPITYYADLYGRVEIPPIKVLTEDGIRALFNLLSLQDYPNNDVLEAVINAIDNTKLDKNNMFIGTLAEYQAANDAGKIPVGAIVCITDVN